MPCITDLGIANTGRAGLLKYVAIAAARRGNNHSVACERGAISSEYQNFEPRPLAYSQRTRSGTDVHLWTGLFELELECIPSCARSRRQEDDKVLGFRAKDRGCLPRSPFTARSPRAGRARNGFLVWYHSTTVTMYVFTTVPVSGKTGDQTRS